MALEDTLSRIGREERAQARVLTPAQWVYRAAAGVVLAFAPYMMSVNASAEEEVALAKARTPTIEQRVGDDKAKPVGANDGKGKAEDAKGTKTKVDYSKLTVDQIIQQGKQEFSQGKPTGIEYKIGDDKGKSEKTDDPKAETRDYSKMSAAELMAAGKKTYEAGRFKLAADLYQKSDDKKASAEALMRKGFALYKANDFDGALKAYKDAKKENPTMVRMRDLAIKNDMASLLYSKASMEFSKDKDAQSEKTFKKALNLEPGNLKIRGGLFVPIGKQGRHAEAITIDETLINENPYVVDFYGGLSWVYEKKADKKAASLFASIALTLGGYPENEQGVLKGRVIAYNR